MTSASEATLHPTVELASGRAPHESGPNAAIGRRIGRYVVLDEVGEGGMGRVYRAYDPKLRREVAVKRLRVVGTAAATAQARMLREAQSMAQLSHPNVVPVYDVDVDDGSLFIAMEYVDGQTLRAWLAERTRDWRSIIAVFIEAAEGLAAAHRQGIVHRDFKPANVIVGRDGRTRVMDFGLARTLDGMPSSELGHAHENVDAPALEVSGDITGAPTDALTEHGTVMGTPAYMAPEQHAGGATDARTDQYALCTALWEALYGARPFRADGIESLAEAKRGPLPRPPAGSAVPSPVCSVVARGLAAVPDDRFADMPTFLTELRRAESRRRPWRAVAVAAVTLAVFGLSLARSGDPPCRHGERELEAAWSDTSREALRDGLARSGAGFAQSTIERVQSTLDAYGTELTAMHREACEATRVHHEQSDEALDLRMACLASRREEMRSVVSLLSAADVGVAEKAIEVTTGLTRVSGCADLAALRSRVPPPADPQIARAVEDARDALARARLSLQASRNADALTTTEATLEIAMELGHAPLLAEAELGHALALWADGQAERARPHVENVLHSALRLSMRHLAAEAAVTLASLLSAKEGRAAGTRWLAEVALGLAEGDGTDASLTAEAMLLVGNVHAQEEHLLEAEPYFRGAVEHVEGALGPEHPDLVSVLSSWASLLDALDRDEEAERVSSRARALSERAFGPDHPQTAAVIRQQGWRMMKAGHYARAEAAFAEAKGILEAALGPDHPSLVGLFGTMAGALAEQGRYEEAAASIQEAERRLGTRAVADHPMRASLSHNLATIRAMQGEHAQAVDHYRRAIEIRRRLGMKNDLAAALGKMGQSLVTLERFEEARAAFEEAERLDIEAHTEGGNRSGHPALQLGKLARRRGDLKAARGHLETAWVFSATSGEPTTHAEASLMLGQTLWELGDERARGHTLVQDALEAAEASESDSAPELAAAARAWLSEHPDPAPDPAPR